MKRIHTLFLILAMGALTSTLNAQELLVYSVTGTVKLVKGKSSAPVALRQKLNNESVVNFKAGSKLVLIDQQAKKQYTLSATGTYSVGKLIAKSQNSVKNLSDMYLSYLMKQINGKGVLTSKTAIDDTYASIERGQDSLFSVADSVAATTTP